MDCLGSSGTLARQVWRAFFLGLISQICLFWLGLWLYHGGDREDGGGNLRFIWFLILIEKWVGMDADELEYDKSRLVAAWFAQEIV